MKRLLNLTSIEFTICILLAWLFSGDSVQAQSVKSNEDSITGNRNQPRLVIQKHPDRITSVAFSPDGKLIVTGTENSAYLWEAASGLQLRRFEESSHISSVAFLPDGQHILTGGWDKTALLWNTSTGEKVRRFEGHRSGITSIAISPNGQTVLTGSLDATVRLWDLTTAQEIRRFEGHSKEVNEVTFSPDGRFVLTGSQDKTARLWDIASGNQIKVFECGSFVPSVAYSPDGRSALVASLGELTARLLNIETGKEVRAFNAQDLIRTVRFSPDGSLVLIVTHKRIAQLWDIATGQQVRQIGRDSSRTVSDGFLAAFSPDGSTILVNTTLWSTSTGSIIREFEGRNSYLGFPIFSNDGHQIIQRFSSVLCIWDATTGGLLNVLQVNSNTIATSPDGSLVLAGDSNNNPRILDTKTGQEVSVLRGITRPRISARFSRDAKLILTTCSEGTVCLWDTTTGQEIRRFDVGVGIKDIALSPDNKLAIALSRGKALTLWDIATGQEIKRFEDSIIQKAVSFTPSPYGHFILLRERYSSDPLLLDIVTGKEVRKFRIPDRTDGIKIISFMGQDTFSRDGRLILRGDGVGTFLWDVPTGRLIRGFHNLRHGSLSPDGRWIVAPNPDGSIQLLDSATGKELCQLVHFTDNSWAVVDQEGRYDAANGGNVKGLHWVVGNEPIALEQLKDRYYEPGLLAKIMGFNTEPMRDVSAFKSVKLFPKVVYDPPSPGSTKITLKLTDRGGGIGKVRVLVNGKEVAANTRELTRTKKTGPTSTRNMLFDLAAAPFIPATPNTIEVIAWNAEGYLSSPPIKREWIPRGAAAARAPTLYAIMGGISNYAAPELNLSFAAKDADDMAKALEVGAKRLFGAEKVKLTLLSTSGAPRALPPTKVNFKKAFEQAKAAKPWDVFVVYLAGHAGALPGSRDIYCYLTQEARNPNLNDPAIRAQTTITSEELVEWIKQVPALKQVMVLDTCQAGAAATRLMEKRDIPSDQIRAIERLKDRTGFHILMGSAADAVSYEASQYGQGLLTYALLQGMRGAALRDGEYVDVSRLFQYAADQVPQLAQHVGGIQRPLIAAPRGTSFDIGQLRREDKELIPLAMAMPMVLRPIFLNPEQGYDNLDLMALVRKRLQEESYATARGETVSRATVFVDADELPGAIRLSGTYMVESEAVKVNGVLIKDGKKVAAFEVTGSKSNMAELTARIVGATTETIRKLWAQREVDSQKR